jgi:predicted transcriptional regulator
MEATMKGKDTNNKLIAVRTDAKTVQTLERIGAELDRSVSWIIRAAIAGYIARYKSPAKEK